MSDKSSSVPGRGYRAVGGFLSIAGSLLSLVSCGLYQPQRYERLAFAPGAPQVRVLMIGDSLTYYNDLPGMLQQFSAGESRPIYMEQITVPLASLKYHWNRGKAVERIRAGHWDFVVLQDFSRRPVTNPEESVKYFRLFDAEIKRSGGRTILFENWTRRGYAGDFEGLAASYERMVRETGALAAPIGAAWKQYTASQPGVKLLMDDRHPTNAGSYLAACVLYDVIYGKKSEDLRGATGISLSAVIADALKRVADRTIRG